MIRLQIEPIRIEPVLEAAQSDADGAVALFVGTVRNHNAGRRVLHLEYHAYQGMAEAEMNRIVETARERFGVSEVVVVHRTGKIEIGEVSVAVAAAAPHRAEALEACRFVIDSLKRSVPIWKKEFFEGGEAWIEGPNPGGDGDPGDSG